MSGALAERTAVITGASSGIGLATARLFAAEGATVFMVGRRERSLEAAAAEIGARAIPVTADVRRLDDLERLFAVVAQRRGQIDVLVANAGVIDNAPIGEITEEQYDNTLATNVKGLVFTVQKALPLLADGAAVILMSSSAALKGHATTTVYAAAKGAISSLARVLMVDLQSRRIRVNLLSPGPVNAPSLSDGVSPEGIAALGKLIPLGRIGEPDEIAAAALFLASDAASFVNGADLRVDGGWTQI